MDGRHSVRIWSIPLLVGILCAVGALPARADDFPIMVQGVTVDAKSNTVTPVGNGPFTALLKTMNLPAAPNAFAEGLGSSKFNLPMFDPIKTGAVGDALGTLYVNVTKFPVSDIEVTMNNLTDTFAGSMGTNGSWNVMVTAPDAQNSKPATLTITAANNGSAIQPNQYLWLMVPAAPSDSNPKKPDQFTMKLAPMPPPPAPPAPVPPAKQGPAMGTGGPGANMSYGAGTGTLTFTDSPINLVQYLDGSTTTTNGPTESILGSTIAVQPTTLIGPDPQVPGAYDFADTLVQVTQGSTLYMSGTLSDVRIYPTSSVPGDTSELVGTLAWEDTYPGLGSRYLSEDYAFSELDDLFVDNNLIDVTDGFLQDGSAPGPIEIASVSVVPEPSTVWLVAVGVMALVTRSVSLRRWSQSG